MFCFCVVRSQESRTEIGLNFRVNSSVVDMTYSDNADRIQEIVFFLRSIMSDPTVELLEVSFCGAASPEGSAQLNTKLARRRLTALENLVREQIEIPEHLITRDDSYIPWDYLREQVVASDLNLKNEIIAIIDEEPRLVAHHYPNRQVDHRVLKLKQLDHGSAWLDMYDLYFRDMRNAYVVFVTRGKVASYTSDDHPVLRPQRIEDLYEFLNTWGGQTTRYGIPALYLKSNALGLALGITNAALELDVSRHLSVTLPLYYSAWNYFKSTTKFRCLLFQPELRYWVDETKTGFFAGGHIGVSSYNFAFGGEYRFQDHDGKTPAIGAGVSLGYRLPLTSDNRWQMEFSLGAGAYALNFDVFQNTPDVKDGVYLSSRRMPYVGLDQALVSVLYRFDLGRKGGRR